MSESRIETDQQDLKFVIGKAQDFHGHLGPFLVVGVRMGLVALKHFGENSSLKVFVKIPLLPPFSCVIDGIQASTKCTVGNQKLSFENSSRDISGLFTAHDSPEILSFCVLRELIDYLTDRLSNGVSVEKLAWDIARLPTSKLFVVEKRIDKTEGSVLV